MNTRLFRQPNLLDWLAAIFLFCLLREWLLPLLELTDTAELGAFYYIIAGVLVLDTLLRARWLTIVANLGLVFWLIHHSFFVTPFFQVEWIKDLVAGIERDIPLAMQQKWLEMSIISRNFLFYLLLLCLVTLLSYLVLRQRQAMWFVFITEAYLAILDTFMPYKADGAIMRALVAGFLLLAVTHFTSMARTASARDSTNRSYGKLLLAPVLIIGVTVGIAYLAPKHDAIWPDPIAYFTGASEGVPTYYMKKVGYDNNDTRLGGPFLPDNSVVFTALTNEKTYWRGDSKDVYTGVGWEKGDREYENILEPATYQWKETLFKGFETKQVEATLSFDRNEQFSTLFFPGQVTKVKNFVPMNTTFVYDKSNVTIETRSGKIKEFKSTRQRAIGGKTAEEIAIVVPNTIPAQMQRYELEAEVPIVSEKGVVNAGTNYPEEIKKKYLELPEKLPARIRELTEQVTKTAKTPYEKVRAVESYLRSSGRYRYETQDVPIPAEGQDFVDQFLFESFRGYCDHFSSAMAVMLRTIDIPTRWVKGFAPGTEIGSSGDKRELEVRNKDAHSWVEVYFPGHGWIPFEATSSFISPVRFKYDLNTDSPIETVTPAISDQKQKGFNRDRLDQLEERTGSTKPGFTITWKGILGIVAVLAILGLYGWKNRLRAYVWWLKRKLTITPEGRFTEKYGTLMVLFEKIIAPRNPGETLREYVNRLQISGDKRQDLWYLTQLFERILYGYKEVEGKTKETANKIMERLSQQLKP